MKTKTLISFAVSAKLICVFVFAYTKSLFSHDAAHIKLSSLVRKPAVNYLCQCENKGTNIPIGETRIILIIRIIRIGGRMKYIGIWILISIAISGTFAA